jgi:integrase
MDAWGWEQLRPWLAVRVELPVGSLFCVIDGPTRRAAVVKRRRPRRASPDHRPGGGAAPIRAHELRHAYALELAREGVALNIIQRQLGHANLGSTSIYPQGATPRRSSPPSAPGAPR